MSFNEAVRLLFKNKVTVYEADPTRGRLRGTLDYPKVLILNQLTEVNEERMSGPPMWSKTGILRRDGYKCGYCAKIAKTIDHILPRSRGGGNTWENCIAACFKCNNDKDNMTPEEWGRKLLWEPWVPTKAELLHRKQ